MKDEEEKQKEYEKSIEYYTKAIELKPDYDSAYKNRAMEYSHSNNFGNAIEDYTKVIELKPDTDAMKNGFEIGGQFRFDYKGISGFEKKFGLNYQKTSSHC